MVIVIKRKYIYFFLVSLIALILFFVFRSIFTAQPASSAKQNVLEKIVPIKEKTVDTFTVLNNEVYTIVVDAGHGGFDPGMVGVNGALEKDINLKIAKILEEYLVYSGANVIMTREDDNGLYNESSRNKKREDMSQRKEIINSSNADILVSIHQNSFSQEKYKGAQVFYYKGSEEGQMLATQIQREIKLLVDESNERKVKDSDSYYILKQTNIPGVIVECGFLSNYQEAELLSTEEYQNKIAWAIYVGILQYFQSIE